MSGDPALDRIEKALAALGDEYAPPSGWEDRVLAASAQGRRLRRAAAAAVLLAAAALLVWWVGSLRRPGGPPQLALVVERGGTAVRGTSANLGDTLHATARGGPHLAVWIYRDDSDLVVACPEGPMCAASEGVVTADVHLDAVGTYSVVALAAGVPLDPPLGSLDQAVAAAATGGAQVRIERVTLY
jgi:hypothetical protein